MPAAPQVQCGHYGVSKTWSTARQDIASAAVRTELRGKAANGRAKNSGKNGYASPTPVVRDGRLYGMFQLKNWGSGPGKCVDIRTRKVLWPREGFAPGNGILARVRLLALSDEGELVIISGRFGNIQTTARADVLEGKCWSTMTLARDSIYARWTKEAACFETV